VVIEPVVVGDHAFDEEAGCLGGGAIESDGEEAGLEDAVVAVVAVEEAAAGSFGVDHDVVDVLVGG